MFNLLTSALASQTRLWAGTKAAKTTINEQDPLIMYDNEADPLCRLVREAISELNLDVLIIPCPKGGERHKQQLQEMYSTDKIPFLIDKNTQTILNSASEIITYLYKHYGNCSAPMTKLRSVLLGSSANSSRLRACPACGTSRRKHLPICR